MKNYFEEICTKLNNAIEIEHIHVVDNSHKHKKHKFFNKDKYHLHLKIKSLELKSMTRLTAQKLIMTTLKEEFENKIHALEISID